MELIVVSMHTFKSIVIYAQLDLQVRGFSAQYVLNKAQTM